MVDLGSFARILGAAAAVCGIVLVTGIVPPNPVFGVRLRQAFASRNHWNRINRFGGGLMAVYGVVLWVSGWLLQDIVVSERSAVLALGRLLPLLPFLLIVRLTKDYAKRTESDNRPEPHTT